MSASVGRQRLRRAANFQTTSNTITFDIKHELAGDLLFELDIGQHPMSLRVFLVGKSYADRGDAPTASAASVNANDSAPLAKARATFQTLAGLGPAGTGTAGVTFYASDSAEQRICDYRHQVRVRGKSDTRPRAPGEINPSDPLLTLASIRSKVYFALSATEPVIDQQLVCYLDPPRLTVPDELDSFHSIWQVAAHYVVSATNQAAVVERLRVKQHLMDDPAALRDAKTGQTPLHVLCENAGDPALAKLLLGTCWKALDPNIVDNDGETAVLKLLQRPAVHDVDGPWHNRACTLLELFVNFGGAALQAQSGATGDTPLHLCMRYHCYGGRLLPLLLSLGGAHATIQAMRNNKGVTPEGELSASTASASDAASSPEKKPAGADDDASSGAVQKPAAAEATPLRARFSALQGFKKSGKDEALRLLSSCDKEKQQQQRATNLLKMRGLPLYRGSGESTSAQAYAAVPASLREPPPELVEFEEPDLAQSPGGSNGRSYARRPVIKAKLAKLIFEKFEDPMNHKGYMSRNALLSAISSYDLIGLPLSTVDRVIDSLGICSDGLVNLEEFTLVLLKLQARG